MFLILYDDCLLKLLKCLFVYMNLPYSIISNIVQKLNIEIRVFLGSHRKIIHGHFSSLLCELYSAGNLSYNYDRLIFKRWIRMIPHAYSN